MFELANPWFLLLLLLPLAYWNLMPKAKIRLSAAVKVPFFAALADITQQEQSSFPQLSPLKIPALVWLFLVFALAGPRWVGAPKPLAGEGYNIMMALDLSGSMEIPDMMLHGRPASRLAVVKSAAEQFVRERSGDQIALILFGTRAYLQTPLTYDRHTILMRLEEASVGLAGKTTSIGDAVGLAIKQLANTPRQGRIVILLTDGANNSGVLAPLKAAELAKEEGIKIYTIGLGSTADMRSLAANFLMQHLSADLDEDTLKEMSALTKGRYFRATDTETLHSIYKTINQLERVSQEQASVRPQKEYYPWFVGFALLLWFYWLSIKTKAMAQINFLLRLRRIGRS